MAFEAVKVVRFQGLGGVGGLRSWRIWIVPSKTVKRGFGLNVLDLRHWGL